MKKNMNGYKILVAEPGRNRLLGRRRWDQNINKNFKILGYRYLDWSGLAEDRSQWRNYMDTVMKLKFE
jgi:hypothetical protein